MSDPAPPCLLSHFSALKDPRQAAKVLYPLDEILLLLLCATIAGADDFVEIGLWGAEHQDFVRRFQGEFDFPGLAALGVIESETERGSVVEAQRRYYLCSEKLDAKTLVRTVAEPPGRREQPPLGAGGRIPRRSRTPALR